MQCHKVEAARSGSTQAPPDVKLIVMKQAVEVFDQLVNLTYYFVFHICLSFGLITLLMHNLDFVLQPATALIRSAGGSLGSSATLH